mmetsp:Transcript_36263/g.35173  ORF Transcript_36263/g.35173 Transcript_36263/m.35173 type:complete len:107 (+) Transcript_36263:84-404(+)
MIKNYLKGALVANGLTILTYTAQFKTFRNSYLLYSNLVAAFLGVHIGAYGVNPLFRTFVFQKMLPMDVLEDQEDYAKSTQIINDFTSLAYIQDLHQALSGESREPP